MEFLFLHKDKYPQIFIGDGLVEIMVNIIMSNIFLFQSFQNTIHIRAGMVTSSLVLVEVRSLKIKWKPLRQDQFKINKTIYVSGLLFKIIKVWSEKTLAQLLPFYSSVSSYWKHKWINRNSFVSHPSQQKRTWKRE